MLKASIQQLLAIYFGLTFSQATQAERPHDQVEQRQPENKPTSADLYGDPLPPGAIARIGTVRFRHGTWIEALAYSPDGRTIAAGDKDGYIRMWEARTGKELWSARVYRTVVCLAFDPDGKFLASTGRSPGKSALILWDTRSGREIRRVIETKESIQALAFSPDGKTLAVGIPNDHVIRVIEPSSGQELRKLTAFPDEPSSLSFSPDGKSLAGPGLDQVIRLWDIATGKELRRLGSGEIVRFSPDGKRLVVGDHDGIRIFEVSSGKITAQLQGDSSELVAITPDGKSLLAASVGALGLYDLSTGKRVRPIGRYWGSILSISLAPDGKTVAVGSTDGALRLWDLETGKQVFPSDAISCVVYSASVAPDEKNVATAGHGEGIRIWDVATGKPGRSIGETDEVIWRVAYSPDGRTLAAGGTQTIRLRDATTGRLIRSWEVHRGGASCVAFSPDGLSLACADLSNTVSLSDVVGGKVRLRISAPDQFVSSVLYSPCGKFLATASNDGQLRVWNAATGQQLRALSTLGDAVLGLAFSPDGRVIASSGRRGSISIWEVATGKERARLGDPMNSVKALAFSPDGLQLTAGTDRGSIRLYNLLTGQEFHKMEGHRGSVDALMFPPGGRYLVSVSQDTTALVRNLAGLSSERIRQSPGRLSDQQLGTLWTDLAHEDAAKAYRAILALAAAREAVPFLKDQLLSVCRAYPERKKQIERLIADLNSDGFKEREDATEGLKRMRDEADTLLLQVLARKPSTEVRRRIQRVLAEGPTGLETLRVLRAVETLELMATPDARKAIEALAIGAPEAPVTREAKASLERLAKRAIKTP